MKKPWAGRFRTATSPYVEKFTESISFDRRLWKHDIQGSIVHARMLGRQGIISRKESAAIIKGLNEIAREIGSGKFMFREDLEDIHMNIETALTEKIGEAGKKLHTARSRNDQIALDLRLYVREATFEIMELLRELQQTLTGIAETHLGTIMPGYTHLQRAQPVLLSHHLMAYVEMFERDRSRFTHSLEHVDVLPLGSCALSGTSLPIDREYVAKQLGFARLSTNSIDAVSDRDFILEFIMCASVTMMHLSRLAEELVIWATEEFRFIEISDSYTTGSSIMPQKKNPDVAELIRGKSGRVYGSLFSMLTLMKGLPLAYNRDMQEDKIPLFDSSDTLRNCLQIMTAMLPEIRFQTERMMSTAGEGFSTATDVAEYLVRKGIPFRKSHEITGKIVSYCLKTGRTLDSLAIKELKTFSEKISDDIFNFLSPGQSVSSRSLPGGTSASEVKKQIKRFKRILS